MSREVFEERDDIKKRRKLCVFVDETNSYIPFHWSDYGSAAYLNGAWSAWQEQQKRIDELKQALKGGDE